MNKQQLAAKIWESANKMRSKIEASEYKDYILGFLFYKFLSDNEISFLKSKQFSKEDIQDLSERDPETVNYIQDNIGYYISYDNLYTTWIEKGSDFDISNVRDALSAFERLISKSHKTLFDGIFDTLAKGLSKLGVTSADQTKAVRDLIQLLQEIPIDSNQDYDVLGFVYEYLISNFAANAGKKAGEFYTPHEVSLLMSEIVAEHLKGYDQIKIYDPTSGSGSLLINIGKSVSKHMMRKDRITYYAQELKENTYNLTRMNLIMRGILPDNIKSRNADTLESDWPIDDVYYGPLYVDAVVSNPPYSQTWDNESKINDARYAGFGIAPRSKADYAFLLHDLYHVKPDGLMTIVLPHGVLFRGGEEATIRKNLIEKNHIDVIIGLPPKIFFGTGIPTIIMVLKKERKKDTNILFIDASKGFLKESKNNKLRASDIKRIVDTIKGRKTISKYSRVVSIDEIRENEYNLNIPRYVDSSDPAETWNLYSIMRGNIPLREVDFLDDYWNEFPSLKEELFIEVNSDYVSFKHDEFKDIIDNNSELGLYVSSYKNEFNNFIEIMDDLLLQDFDKINIQKTEIEIADLIFDKVEKYKLFDIYRIYQTFYELWTRTAIDLEVVKSEGFAAVKVVEPNLVLKKKEKKEIEVQEGWKGRVLPFELVQQQKLKVEFDAINELGFKLTSLEAELGEIVESFDEEEKEDLFSDDSEKVDNKKVDVKLKILDKSKDEESLYFRLNQYTKLTAEIKKVNKEIKTKNNELHMKTKSVIEKLTDAEAISLLREKWINPVYSDLINRSKDVANDIHNKLKTLKEKYSSTLIDVENEITEVEQQLIPLLNELEGSEFDKKALKELINLLGGSENA